MTKQGALEELIKSMFNDAELRSFLGKMAKTASLLAGIPGGSASPQQVMFETVGLPDRNRVIDSEFFEALSVVKPRLRQEIQEVAAMWGLTFPARDVRAATASGSTPGSASTSSLPLTPTPTLTAGPTTLPADVAILIALTEEWEVFWPIAGEPGGVKDDSGGYLYYFDVPGPGRPYRCVALFMGAMGPGQATHATTRLLAAKPKAVVNLGIAAAIHDDLKLCDVVVAEQVDGFLSTVKAVPKGKDGWTFEARGSVYRATHALVQDLVNLKFAHRDTFTRWHSMCAPAMAERAGQLGAPLAAKHIRDAPVIMNVHLASGPVLAAAESFSKWIRTRDGLLKALEMEAAGMMLAAHQQADPARTLVLRGISDFGDERKSQTDRDSGGAFRYLAMFNATQLLWAMMRQGLLPRHERTSGGPTGGGSSVSTNVRSHEPVAAESRHGSSASTDAGSPPGLQAEVDLRWTDAERLQIENILATLLRDAPALSRSLEIRLALRMPTPVGAISDDVHARVARRIVSLGRGSAAALALAQDCCRAVIGEMADARGEQREARRLLEQWLPRGYGGEARVVLLRLSGSASPEAAGSAMHIEVGTLSPFIAEVHVARQTGRPAAFATRHGLVEGLARMPTRVAGSEILTGDGIARAIIRAAFKRYSIEPATSPAMAMLKVVSDLETRRELTGRRHYVVFTGTERRDERFAAVIQRLRQDFPELQLVALGEEPGSPDAIPDHIRHEVKLLTYLQRIFRDPGRHDDDI